MKNKYIKQAHISENKFREVLKFFAEDFTVTQISKLTCISRFNINKLIQKIRHRVYLLATSENPLLKADIEADESYFGAKRVRGLRGRGAKGKIKVFGLLKRNEKVYTEVVDDVSAKNLQSIKLEAKLNLIV